MTFFKMSFQEKVARYYSIYDKYINRFYETIIGRDFMILHVNQYLEIHYLVNQKLSFLLYKQIYRYIKFKN